MSRSSDSASTADRILDAFRRLVTDRGLDGTTTRLLAEEAGVALAAFPRRKMFRCYRDPVWGGTYEQDLVGELGVRARRGRPPGHPRVLPKLPVPAHAASQQQPGGGSGGVSMGPRPRQRPVVVGVGVSVSLGRGVAVAVGFAVSVGCGVGVAVATVAVGVATAGQHEGRRGGVEPRHRHRLRDRRTGRAGDRLLERHLRPGLAAARADVHLVARVVIPGRQVRRGQRGIGAARAGGHLGTIATARVGERAAADVHREHRVDGQRRPSRTCSAQA